MTARLSGFAETATSIPAVALIDLAPHQRVVVDTAEALPGMSSVMVELSGGAGIVEHRLVSERSSDVGRCTTIASGVFYFPAVDTSRDVAGGAASVPPVARLWLLNPFPTDASVDVLVAQEDGVRVPPSLRGLVVPGGSVRSIDLGQDALQRRSQGSVTVLARAGQIVAELSQSGDGVGGGEGLRLQLGIPRAEQQWLFADGFAGAGVTERYVVLNPGNDAVTVELAVSVAGDQAFQPEPFVRDIPARRFTVFDLHQESRLPESGLRWVTITTESGTGVAVARVVALTQAGDGATDRPAVANGLAGSTGSTEAASAWAFGSAGLEDGSQVVSIANPDPEAIAVVKLTRWVDGVESAVGDPVEVAPGASFAVDVTAGVAVPNAGVVLTVSSSTPVVAEFRSSTDSRVDLSVAAGSLKKRRS